MFIDALGWQTVSRNNFLSDLLPYRRPIEMQFGYSCSAIPTILSGKRPCDHKHLSFFRFSPSTSPFKKLSMLSPIMQPASFWERGRIRHWLSKIIKKLYGFTGYFQLYSVPIRKLAMMDYCEKINLFESGGLESVENLKDVLEKTDVKYHISDWHLNDERNIEEGCKAIENGATFLFLYTAELDAIQHEYVLQNDVIKKKLDWYQEQIKKLFETCKSLNKSFNLTIFSDHGMTPLTETVDLKSAVENTGLVFGKDYGACYDSTLMRLTYITPGSKDILHKAIESFQDKGHWLTQEEEITYGIYREDRFFGDEIFLVNPGIQIVPSDMGKKPLNGMHGFAPEDINSRAAIMSTSPLPDSVKRVCDYFPMMISTFM